MNVAFFSNQFSDRYGHGLARYARELFEALRNADSGVDIVPVSAWSSLDDKDRDHMQRENGLQLLPWGRRLTPLAWALLDTPAIEHWLHGDFDLVHAVALGYPVATRKPYVVTVHDIGPLTHPGYFSPKGTWIMKRSLAQAVNKAAAIICVSHSTANELETYVGGSVTDRVRVIHEGVSPHFMTPPDDSAQALLKKLGIGDEPYILSAGAISPRKNTLGIIKALARLADVIPHHLVLAGGEGWSMQNVHDELSNSPIAHRVHMTGYVSDEQLKGLFAAASAYLHPSLYEGFGLTLLEAMAQDCPVVTSNIYSLPEVAGDAALLVDPRTVEQIADAIEAVCSNSCLAADLVARGKKRLEAFSWDACARGVMDVYRGVL